jgi:UDP-N-acetylmuramyl pentapeptide phosphotransferase/UDP-N-acetylglucosamine-1-phosphate transferase
MPALPVWLLLHFAGAAIGTWWARRYALKGNLLDQPGERRSHAVATPRGGGIAIVVMVVLASLLAGLQSADDRWLLWSFVPGLLIVAGIGWWDDHQPLSPWLRLGVQAVAAATLALGVWSATGVPGYAVFAFLAVMALVNVWNFMDGINGLAASQAWLAALAYAALMPADGAVPWVAWALFAAAMGFLPFNFPRARIFMGDVGSGALGYTLAMLATTSLGAAPRTTVPLILLPLCVFLVDAGFTLAWRMLRGERWWTPHVSHLYQWAARRVGHVAVTVIYFVFGSVTLLLSFTLPNTTFETTAAVVAGAYGFGGALWVLLRRGWRD